MKLEAKLHTEIFKKIRTMYTASKFYITGSEMKAYKLLQKQDGVILKTIIRRAGTNVMSRAGRGSQKVLLEWEPVGSRMITVKFMSL